MSYESKSYKKIVKQGCPNCESLENHLIENEKTTCLWCGHEIKSTK